MWAAGWDGHLEVVRILLEWGADINLQCKASGYSSHMLLDVYSNLISW